MLMDMTINEDFQKTRRTAENWKTTEELGGAEESASSEAQA